MAAKNAALFRFLVAANRLPLQSGAG